MFEAILNKNLPVKRIQTTSRSVLTTSIVLSLLLVIFFIWQAPIIASFDDSLDITQQQIHISIVETVLILAVAIPLIIRSRHVLENWLQSQSFFQTLFHDSVEPILLYQLDGQITACNPALEKWLGYNAEQLKQMSFQDLIVSDGQELAHLFRTGESGNHAQATLALESHDQRVFFAIAHEQRIQIRGKVQLLSFLEDITASHIENQKNQILGEITSTLLEIKELRQVHQTVCADIARSSDSLVVLLGIFNPRQDTLDIVEFNGTARRLEQFNKWRVQNLQPGGLHKIQINEEDIEWLMTRELTPFSSAPNQFFLASFTQYNVPDRILARCLFAEKDEITSIIILDYNGHLDAPFTEQMLYFHSTAISRMTAEAKLNRSQAQLSETQTLVKVGRLQYDFKTDRSLLSRELCALLGTPETTTAVELIRMIHPDDRPAFAQLLDKIIEYPTRDQIRLNFRMLHADGHTLYLRSQSKISFDEEGRPQYLIMAIHDATELMSARDRLQQQEGAYNQLVKERQMLEERVSVQVSALENVNKNLNTALMVKDEFLASMSSNLKAPLTAILGAAELLSTQKRGELNNDQFRYVNLIERSGTELLNSINTILDLTKFSLNKEEISQEKVNLRDLCQSSMHYAQTFANHKHVQLQYEIKAKQLIIIGDPIRLRQIITILLRQAITASPEKGTVKLNIFTHTDPQFILIQISDGGSKSVTTILEPERHGIDPNNQQSLELEIANRLTELHGGSLKVMYQKDKGNTVIVLLPRWGIKSKLKQLTPLLEKDVVDPDEIQFRR